MCRDFPFRLVHSAFARFVTVKNLLENLAPIIPKSHLNVNNLPDAIWVPQEQRIPLTKTRYMIKDDTVANACSFGRILCEHLFGCGTDMK